MSGFYKMANFMSVKSHRKFRFQWPKFKERTERKYSKRNLYVLKSTREKVLFYSALPNRYVPKD